MNPNVVKSRWSGGWDNWIEGDNSFRVSSSRLENCLERAAPVEVEIQRHARQCCRGVLNIRYSRLEEQFFPGSNYRRLGVGLDYKLSLHA